MKRLFIAALVVVAVGAIAGTALAGVKSSVIFDSTNSNGGPTNMVSYGPAAYSFSTIGDQITFKNGTARGLSNVTVTLSSWACQTGAWNANNCATQSGATFSQPITLSISNVNPDGTKGALIATSTKTFDVPYRPSASPKCTDANAGKWMTPAKECKNGLANDVTFNSFTPSNVTLPETVVYEISYPTGGPADSLNVAVTTATPSVGASPDTNLWIDGAPNADFGLYTPAVQFKAGNAS
jgi:hypothetical protein